MRTMFYIHNSFNVSLYYYIVIDILLLTIYILHICVNGERRVRTTRGIHKKFISYN